MALTRANPAAPTTEVAVVDQQAPMVTSNIIDVDSAVAQWKAYEQVTKRILEDTDYLTLGDTRFKKKSAWRKYKRAFNVSTEIIEKNITKLPNGRTQEAEFVVRATLPDGTFSDGYGVCSIDEYHGNKPNHDIPATAQTRATNRAISDLIGAGEVTAEEAKDGIIEEELSEPKKEEPEEKSKKKTTTKKNANAKTKSVIDVEAKDIEVVK